MSSGHHLSQEELDALISAIEPEAEVADEIGSTATDHVSASTAKSAQPQRKKVKQQPFDPGSQARIVRERLHTLEVINERFARQFRMNLFNLLRRNADITVDSVRYQRFSDFADATPSPANLNIISMKPLRGSALVVFPHALVSIIVENLFGGDGRFMTRNEAREFTATEQRIINRVLNLAIDAYQESWRAVHPLEISFIRSEVQPKFAAITSSPSEIVVTTTFRLEVGHLESTFKICMPYAMVEPLRDKLSNLRADIGGNSNDKAWRQRITHELQSSSVEVIADFVEIPLRLPQVMSLKPGDILPIELPATVMATVNSLPIMECEFGTIDEHRALKVKQMLDNHRFPQSILRDSRKGVFTPLRAKESSDDE
ncbi:MULTISPECIES: flagellar motor switch protein FliM [Idiomarinaceae]|uniref:Flagellar motor switch protein FliM n=1 Tax=Pseudidiomarina fusca TaxID=2965078 RepID=A0ABU3L076_9GAMM|nr:MULTISPECIES: flagellar motor switch protein FliM [Idiomarinaceae]MDX1526780.1 flagellar motor switch protein FliM [Pseudidiomarina maritima]MDT7526588.1 flagellar motor switch protein FliM [Pseudidiomarina sp. GXY010]MRJ42099.1 flagellar motor switch protein FliM [Idiomarina sp. FeN1]NCU57024.1 flagellar motor switch protein FliM [Idiomarina sp. FenA--70]NCU59733.1 flagellar motor switch protein FliM [Idiomarina sp. FenBw--71]